MQPRTIDRTSHLSELVSPEPVRDQHLSEANRSPLQQHESAAHRRVPDRDAAITPVESRSSGGIVMPARWSEVARVALATDDSKTALLQRVVLGGVVFGHGLQKVFGWFGGYGLDGTLGWFDSALGVPTPIAGLVVASDFIGALALALGLMSRLTAFGVTLTMVGAIAMVHAPNGFFMNWSGTLAGEGYEFHLLALALSLPLVVRGGGAWSIDGWLSQRLRATPSRPGSSRGLPSLSESL